MMPEAQTSSTKRRACDECRSRKLACSKEAEGCERCIRENIKCHYSEQKPMGRPRKRQFIETTKENPVEHGEPAQDLGLLPFFADDLNDYNDGSFAEPYFTAGPMLEPLPTELPNNTQTDDGRVIFPYGDKSTVGPPIPFGLVNFGDIDFTTATSNTDISSTEVTPQLSTGSNPSIGHSNTSSPAPIAPCSCLASMYLALASLQTISNDIKSTLRTIRSAAEVAQNCIWCPYCGSVMLRDEVPPMESFQNTMLLGTILPVIANGYGRVLQFIDDETNAAIAAGQKKTFQFHDYGGLACGLEESLPCVAHQNLYDNMEMEPTTWRTTVRALLRIDVYGFEHNGMKHKGLKDIIGEMEERQRTRHHILDHHMAAGTAHEVFPKYWLGGHLDPQIQQKCLGEMDTKNPTCLEIIKMARLAIDALVIA